MRICERNISADIKVREEGRAGGVPGARAEIALQPVVQIMVRQLCLCNSVGEQRCTKRRPNIKKGNGKGCSNTVGSMVLWTQGERNPH